MLKLEKLHVFVDRLGILVEKLSDMQGLFGENYDGGDFCKGIIFGKDGVELLFNISQSFIEDKTSNETDNDTIKYEKTTSDASSE